MTITVNFVAAVGRVSAGAISAKPKIEAICAKYAGRVVGGLGSSFDPIVAEFADKMAAAQAANEAFHLDDVEDARVVGADVGNVGAPDTTSAASTHGSIGENVKTEEEIDQLCESGIGNDDMVGHDARLEVHVRPGGDHELVKHHIKAAYAAVGGHLDDENFVTEHDVKNHPIDDYQYRHDDAKEKNKHTVVHTMPSGDFTDPDRPDDIHSAVRHLRRSPAASHISAIKVTHDYCSEDDHAMEKPANKSSAGEWSEAIDAIIAGKSASDVIDEMLAAPAK